MTRTFATDPAPARRPAAGRPAVLLADHRGGGTSPLAALLAAAGHPLQVAASPAATAGLVAASRPAVVLLEPTPGHEREELALLRADPPLPVLLRAEAGDLVSALELVHTTLGAAADAVAADAGPAELLARLERLAELGLRLGELEALRHRALHDERTELLRPEAFEERLAAHVSAARRHRLPLALVLLDLDRFGRVNKEHDHTVGDRVIERVGAALRGALRREDVAGRLGGDEFAVLLPHTAPVEAARAAQRLRAAVRSARVALPGGGELRPTASLGFETYDGRDLPDLATLRAHAERALRAAKEAAGDTALYYRSLRLPRRA